MPNALALSPHLDDAAFSAGGALAVLAARGWSVTVATVFTASVPDPRGFALACQLDKGLPPDIDYMALRREEDRAACARLGAVPRWLGLPEAPHRGYHSAPALFGPPHERDQPALAALLDATVRTHRPDLVLAPQGLGGHVDHVHLVRSLLAMPSAVPVLWWRDFPYAARAEVAEPFGRVMGALAEFVVPLDDDASARKQDACLSYRSQIGFQFGGAEALRSMVRAEGDRERFRAQGAVPW